MPLPTVYDAVMAVHDGRVDRALVPIENSLEGSVNATLDALAFETDDVAIVGELVQPVRHCLIAREPRWRSSGSRPSSPTRRPRPVRPLPARRGCRARAVVPAASTAEAVRRSPSASGEPWRGARQRAWPPSSTAATVLARRRRGRAGQRDPLRLARAASRAASRRRRRRRAKTSLVFWGAGSDAPGLAGALPVRVRRRAA